jgi:hypothetical protein
MPYLSGLKRLPMTVFSIGITPLTPKDRDPGHHRKETASYAFKLFGVIYLGRPLKNLSEKRF